MTLFLAGHETTANTLSWAWFLLSQHPEAEARLHDEIDRCFEGRLPTLADLPRLKYTESVVNEAFASYPTGWMIGREATEPLELGGYRVAKGTTIFMTACVIHRDPRWYRRSRMPSVPNAGPTACCSGSPAMPISPSAAGRGSASATTSPSWRRRWCWRRSRGSTGSASPPTPTVEPLPTMTLRPAHGLKMVFTIVHVIYAW